MPVTAKLGYKVHAMNNSYGGGHYQGNFSNSQLGKIGNSISPNRNSSKNQEHNKFATHSHHHQVLNHFLLLDSSRILMQFDAVEIDSKSNEEILSQIKKMRQILVQLNSMVNSKLNKYEVAHLKPKGFTELEPDKESELLSNQIEINEKYLDKQNKEIEAIHTKDRQFEQKDFLIELEQNTNDILKDIHAKSKDKHKKLAAMGKLDDRLIELSDSAFEDQFQVVKVLKHQTWHYFKSLNENKATIEQLDRSYQSLLNKDNQINLQYNNLLKVMEQKNIIIKSNKHYLQQRKKVEELKLKVEQVRKKKQVIQYSYSINTDKISREIRDLHKQLQKTEKLLQRKSEMSVECAEKADKLIEEHSIDKIMINSLPFRYAQNLLNGDKLEHSKATMQPNNGIQNDKTKPLLKPKLIVKKEVKNGTKNYITSSAEINSHSRTLEPVLTSRKGDTTKQLKNNDKNHDSIELEKEQAPRFNTKPKLRIRRPSDKNENRLSSSKDQLQVNENGSKMVEIPSASSRLSKLKPVTKEVSAGPLPDSYLKGLQQKGVRYIQEIR